MVRANRSQPPVAPTSPSPKVTQPAQGPSRPTIRPASASTAMSVRIYAASVPTEMEGGGYAIQLTREADRSPFPSFVDLSDFNSSRSIALGVSVANIGFPGATLSADASIQSELKNFVLGAGLEKSRLLSSTSPISIAAGLGLLASLVTGQIGTVGSRAGDVYPITPDGAQYEAGSRISVTGLGFGGEATSSIQYRLGGQGFLFVAAGYRWSTAIDNWNYQIRDDDQTSKLPSYGFVTDPPPFVSRGPLLRVGFGF